MKIELRYKLQLMTRYPHDRSYREDYYKFRRNYRKLIKSKENDFKDKILKKLGILKDSDPQSYWKLLDTLRKKKQNPNDMEAITPHEWYSYFKKLNCRPEECDDTTLQQLLSKEKLNSGTKTLDYAISEKEIHDAISRLKRKKSGGHDLLLNEMIIHGRHILTPIILKLLNSCLDLAYFRKFWNKGSTRGIFMG